MMDSKICTYGLRKKVDSPTETNAKYVTILKTEHMEGRKLSKKSIK